ncbi:MAG: hypothetical protein RJA78_32 [Actinomycetota bacterium]|jgi:uncharacterized membrane protein
MSLKPARRFQYVQHPHIQARKTQDPSQGEDLDLKPKSLNQRIGLAITKSVGTMWAAYIFVALTLVSLPAVIVSGDPVLIVAWIAQTFLQLVLLPIIIVGQNIQAAAAEKRATLTYQDAEAVLEEAIKIQKHLDHQDQYLEHLSQRLEQLEVKNTKTK